MKLLYRKEAMFVACWLFVPYSKLKESDAKMEEQATEIARLQEELKAYRESEKEKGAGLCK